MDPAAAARNQFILRFSFGTTVAFVACEYMGWQPSALAPVLTGVLLANLPTAPPLKVGLGLTIVMALSAWLAFFATTYLNQSPHILFALIGLILFIAFWTLAQARSQLPCTLLLVCFAVIPVVTLTVSEFAGVLPGLFVRAMALGVLMTWVAFAIWPLPAPRTSAAPPAAKDNPIAAAAVATAVVLPMMLVYLLFGLTDAIPVLLTTVLLVAKMDGQTGMASASAKLVGNFLGGFVAVAAFYLLQVWPTLTTLALITFLIGIGFASHIVKGGVRGGNALIAYNAAIVIFGLALLKGPAASGTWSARVVQFGIAWGLAIAMMALLVPRLRGGVRKPA